MTITLRPPPSCSRAARAGGRAPPGQLALGTGRLGHVAGQQVGEHGQGQRPRSRGGPTARHRHIGRLRQSNAFLGQARLAHTGAAREQHPTGGTVDEGGGDEVGFPAAPEQRPGRLGPHHTAPERVKRFVGRAAPPKTRSARRSERATWSVGTEGSGAPPRAAAAGAGPVWSATGDGSAATTSRPATSRPATSRSTGASSVDGRQEAVAPTVDRADQPLALPVVAHGAPSRLDPTGEGGLAHEAVSPDAVEQLLLADAGHGARPGGRGRRRPGARPPPAPRHGAARRARCRARIRRSGRSCRHRPERHRLRRPGGR